MEKIIEEAKKLVAESIALQERQIKSGAYLVDRALTLHEAIEIIREQPNNGK